MSLVLENASFSQELSDTFQQPTETLSFEASKIRNSRRRKSKAIINANKRIRKARARVRKAMTAKRKLTRSIR